MLQAVFGKILDILFPPACLSCGQEKTYLCPACLAKLPTAGNFSQPDVLTVFDYKDRRVKRAVWLLKYKGARKIAEALSRAIYDKVSEELAEINAFSPAHGGRPWLVVPIPLSRHRERQRGFNQATELAKHLVGRDQANLELADRILIKIKETKSQMEIKNREERLKNLRGAFAVVGPESLAKRNVLLVDDVITSGGTVNEARRVIEQAGAKRVIAVAVAHG